MTRRRAGTLAATAVSLAAALVVVTPRAVGACGVGTSFSLSGPGGPNNQQVVATGVGFADAPVQLRWGSTSGQLLATTHGPLFKVTLTIPSDAKPGYYFVDAWDGSGQMFVNTTFQVTQPATVPPPPPPGPGTTGVPSGPPPPPAGSHGTVVPVPSGTTQHVAAPVSTSARQAASVVGSRTGVTAPVAAQPAPPAAQRVTSQPANPGPGQNVVATWRGLSDDVSSGLAAGTQPSSRVAGASGGQGGNSLQILGLVLVPMVALAGIGAVAVRRRKSEAVN